MSTKPEPRVKYLHTLFGMAAHYYPGGQICYTTNQTHIALCPSLKVIKWEQRAS